jgi:hypothetical protein
MDANNKRQAWLVDMQVCQASFYPGKFFHDPHCMASPQAFGHWR